MKVQRLSMVAVIMTLACVGTDEGPIDERGTGSGGHSTAYYPHSVVSTSSSPNQPQEDFWDCGVDYVVTRGPQGETIIVEVRIPCDPLADIYIGCPAPLQKK